MSFVKNLEDNLEEARRPKGLKIGKYTDPKGHGVYVGDLLPDDADPADVARVMADVSENPELNKKWGKHVRRMERLATWMKSAKSQYDRMADVSKTEIPNLTETMDALTTRLIKGSNFVQTLGAASLGKTTIDQKIFIEKAMEKLIGAFGGFEDIIEMAFEEAKKEAEKTGKSRSGALRQHIIKKDVRPSELKKFEGIEDIGTAIKKGAGKVWSWVKNKLFRIDDILESIENEATQVGLRLR